MIYIYDVLSNFQKYPFDIWEWVETDQVIHIKRINVLKVTKQQLIELSNNSFKLDEKFLDRICNTCEVYTDSNKVKTLPYAFIVMDGYNALAIHYINETKILKSNLLVDDEKGVIQLNDVLQIFDNKFYDITTPMIRSPFILRKNFKVQKEIRQELEITYKNERYDLINYLYFELFEKETIDYKMAYHKILESLQDSEFVNKITKIFELIKM